LPAAQVSVPKCYQASNQLTQPSPGKTTWLWGKLPPSTIDYNNAYIDPTKYSIGATSGYEAPSRVVLSERSMGCRAVFRQGQGVSGSLCGTTLQQRRTRVAIRGTHSINPPAWTQTQMGKKKSICCWDFASSAWSHQCQC